MLEAEKLQDILFNKKSNGWENLEEDKKKEIYKFNDEYIHYLNKCKTERETIEFSKEILDKNGFTDIKNKEKLSVGDKVYYINRDKSMYIAVIGEKPLEGGLNIVGAHVDSPRLDLKPNPLYEDQGFRIFKNSLLWWNKEIPMDHNSTINSWCYY
jgi:aspartyl aminopeptidase